MPSTCEDRFNILSNRIRQCQRCTLHKYIRNYVTGTLGTTHPELMFVSEWPNAMEDITGEPLKGSEGGVLKYYLEKIVGVKREEVTIVNMVKCKPPTGEQPSQRQRRICRAWLLDQIRIIDPQTIVTLGVNASQILVGNLTMEELRKYYYQIEGRNAQIYPTFHPGGVAYVANRREEFERDLKLLRKQDGKIQRFYLGVRQHGRCTLPINEPQDSDCGGTVLSPPTD